MTMWYCEVKDCGATIKENRLPTGGCFFECSGCGARYYDTRKLKQVFFEKWEEEEQGKRCEICGCRENHSLECPMIKKKADLENFHKRWG